MRHHATPHTVANEVRMIRTHHRGAFLVVEGPSDKTAYWNLVDQGTCRIVIAHGRDNVEDALQILEADGFRGVLGISDADFRHLEETPVPSGNVLLTDLHDLESMMIASAAFAKVLNDFAVPERISDFEQRVGCTVAAALTKEAATVGYLRWISARNSLGLNFEGLSFGKFLDRQNLQVNLKALLKTLKDHSRRHHLDDSKILSGFEAMRDPAHDARQVACGHDVLEILSLGLRKTLAARNEADVKRESLERSLRLAYEASYFVQTQLCQSIRVWEEANSPYRVLPPVE
jgi:hypothetical protein